MFLVDRCDPMVYIICPKTVVGTVVMARHTRDMEAENEHCLPLTIDFLWPLPSLCLDYTMQVCMLPALSTSVIRINMCCLVYMTKTVYSRLRFAFEAGVLTRVTKLQTCFV